MTIWNNSPKQIASALFASAPFAKNDAKLGITVVKRKVIGDWKNWRRKLKILEIDFI